MRRFLARKRHCLVGAPALLEKGVVMMGRYAVPVFFVVMAVCALCAASACAPTSGTPVMQAFDRYEAIRVALSQDKIDLVSQEATALAPLAGQLAGEEAQASASRLASATTLNRARLEFISVSSELVPKFLDAKLPAVHGFMCPLQDGRTVTWAQRSVTIQNPYFGKAMLDCGTELPASE